MNANVIDEPTASTEKMHPIRMTRKHKKKYHTEGGNKSKANKNESETENSLIILFSFLKSQHR